MSAEPRHHTPRSTRETRGPQVAALAKAKGQPALPWQRDMYDVALEIDPATGTYWYDTVVVLVQRQAGKTKGVGDVAEHRCLTKRRARTWFTQQSGKYASAWMREQYFPTLTDAKLLYGVEGSPSCKYQLSRRAGSEGVLWVPTQSTFTAFPPKHDAMHSKQSDLTVVDEAWAHDAVTGAELRQAIRPTMATRPGSQLWVVSAAGTDDSAYLDEYVAQGLLSLADPTSRTAIVDYGIPEDADPEDLETILRWHPAYGLTQSRESFLAARQDFANDPAGWARAYGTRASRARTSVWPENVWNDCGTGRFDPAQRPERVGLAFDVTPSGDRASLASAWRQSDGRAYVQLLHVDRPGDDFARVVRQVAEAQRVPVDYDPRSPGALRVLDKLGADPARGVREVETRAVDTKSYAAACLELSRLVFARELRHMHQAQLTEATRNTVAIPALDGGFVWGRKVSTGSIAELVSATVALRAFDTLPVARRKAVVRGGRRVAAAV